MRPGMRGRRSMPVLREMSMSGGRMKRTVRIFFLASIGGAAPGADAATIVVNDAGTVVQSTDSRCTLLEAVTAAQNDAASGSAAGECAAGGGPDTIVLQASTQLYTLTTVNNIGAFGANGLPRVSTTITIDGNGATVQRSGAAGTPEFRLLEV